MKQGVRILRVLEYEYPDIERAEAAMERWTPAVRYAHERMRSAVMPFEAIEWETAEEDEPESVGGDCASVEACAFVNCRRAGDCLRLA